MIYFYLIISVIMFYTNLKSVLDGRITPIYLDNRYTFTNFEWARGNVYFKNGFDLPTGGTVILDITQGVDGGIGFNNSTLIFNNDIRLSSGNVTGIGYINARGYTLYLDQNFTLQPGYRLIFIGNIAIEGNGTNFISFFNGEWAFTTLCSALSFKNLDLRYLSATSFYTASNAPTNIYLHNVRINLINSYTCNATNVQVWDRTTLVRGGQGAEFRVNNFYIQSFGDIVISSGVTFSVSKVFNGDPTGGITLQNARLNFTSTTTSDYLYSRIGSALVQGFVLARGQSQITTAVSKEIIVPKNVKIQLDTGSTLRVSPNISLKIT